MVSEGIACSNARVKSRITEDGKLIPYELQVFSRSVFVRNGFEAVSTASKGMRDSDAEPTVNKGDGSASNERSARRAKSRVRDLLFANLDDMRYMVTLTFSAEAVDRFSYEQIVKKLNTFLDNSVRRNGLMYLLVAERHKDGAVHFHGIVNEGLRLVDSGYFKRGKYTLSRAEVADRRRGDKPIYNIKGFSFGFNSVIEITGKSGKERACSYALKYITKSAEKVGGRYYLHGGAFRSPVYSYFDVGINDIPGEEYELEGNLAYKAVRCSETISGLMQKGVLFEE